MHLLQRPQLILFGALELGGSLEMSGIRAVPLYPHVNQSLNAGCPWGGA